MFLLFSGGTVIYIVTTFGGCFPPVPPCVHPAFFSRPPPGAPGCAAPPFFVGGGFLFVAPPGGGFLPGLSPFGGPFFFPPAPGFFPPLPRPPPDIWVLFKGGPPFFFPPVCFWGLFPKGPRYPALVSPANHCGRQSVFLGSACPRATPGFFFLGGPRVVLGEALWPYGGFVEGKRPGRFPVPGSLVHSPSFLCGQPGPFHPQEPGADLCRAVIDAAASFAPGQVYVALSRCQSMEGMVLGSPLQPEAVRTDPRVRAFLEHVAAIFLTLLICTLPAWPISRSCCA